jgi:hypothetical protein
MRSRPLSSQALVLAVLAPVALGACGSTSSSHGPPGSSNPPATGESSFLSAPPGSNGGTRNAAVGGGGGAADFSTAAPTAAGASQTSAAPRTVQETDLYRLEGTRLYYLNSYRGLMVFDVSDVDHPTLLGRSAIFGDPIDMIVNQGIAVVVVGNWYGHMDDGSPFHGSIVRGLDATDPTSIKVIGEAKLGGWVRDDRVVGSVLYAVSQQEPQWIYDWEGGVVFGGVGGVGVAVPAGGGVSIGGGGGSGVIVSSVDFSNGQIKQVASKKYDGYGGVFNVTANSILLAHPDSPPQPQNGPYVAPTKTDLVYLDISDPAGQIVERSTLQADGVVGTWGADNGRWNLDFADGKTAHVIGSPNGSYGGTNGSYILATADFSNPDQPALVSELTIPGTSWVPTARFDSGRMYLSPDAGYSSSSSTTPLEVFDLTNPAAPRLAGQTQIPGSVWLMIPAAGSRLFALGSDRSQMSSQVALNYVDVTNAASPTVIGTSTFGEGWASTPASSTFKAFTMDPNKMGPNHGLVVLPFSGWDAAKGAYNNGVQLIEFTPSTLATGGAARTRGWVERGIFVNNRIVSLSNLALSVVDYSTPSAPQVTAELTLARSVVTAQPTGTTIAELSSDWWDNDVSHSDVRILPLTDAEENVDESTATDTPLDGINARVFTNGNLDYVATDVRVEVPCGANGGGRPTGVPGAAPQACYGWQEQVQVVDLSNGGATLRGRITLPMDSNYYGRGWGWYGCYAYDWFDGGDIVQVDATTLAFRRWTANYAPNGQYVDASSNLFVVDLSNPDAPHLASIVITSDPTGWWGNMRVVGGTLYTTHTEWNDHGTNGVQPTVRYYLDRIDLTDPKNPKVGSKINVPGVLVGGSASDPSVLYTIDYRWDGTNSRDDLDVIKISGSKAYLQSATPLDGYVGNVFVRGTTAYMSATVYPDRAVSGAPHTLLHQIDLSDPRHPLDRVTSGAKGWGWLLAVEGDRAMVTSGWGSDGLDIYRLSDSAAPVFDQFVRTRGWGINSLSRQGNQLFLSSGYWGVQAVTLK